MEGIIPVIQFLWLLLIFNWYFFFVQSREETEKMASSKRRTLNFRRNPKTLEGFTLLFLDVWQTISSRRISRIYFKFCSLFQGKETKAFNLTELFFKYYLQSIFSRNFCFIFALFSYRWKIPMFSNLLKLEWSPKVGNGLE